MKKVIIAIALLIASASVNTINAEQRIEGSNIVEVAGAKQKSENRKTPYTYTNKKGEVFSTYITKNGRVYAEVVSRNGNTYRKYMDEAIAREIAKKMGVEYKENARKTDKEK